MHMRHIGDIQDGEAAERFGDFLFAQGIDNEIEREDDASLVWVHSEAQIESARHWLQKFQADPNGSDFANATAEADRLRREKESENKKAARRFHEARDVFSRNGPPVVGRYRAGPVTRSVIILCIICGLLSGFGDKREVMTRVFLHFGLLSQGEFWRLIAPCVFHFGLMHILFNLLAMHFLGSMIESRRGSAVLALQLVVFGIGSNLVQAWSSLALGNQHYYAFVGLSGALFGLFGYAFACTRLAPERQIYIDQTNVIFAGLWLLLGFLPDMPFANGAHFGGLVLGLLWGWIECKRRAA